MEPFKFLEPEYRHAANNFSKLFIEIFRGSDNEEYKDFKCENIDFGVQNRVKCHLTFDIGIYLEH